MFAFEHSEATWVNWVREDESARRQQFSGHKNKAPRVGLPTPAGIGPRCRKVAANSGLPTDDAQGATACMNGRSAESPTTHDVSMRSRAELCNNENLDSSAIRTLEVPAVRELKMDYELARGNELREQSFTQDDIPFNMGVGLGPRRPSLKKIGSYNSMSKSVSFSDQHGLELENVQEIPARAKNLLTAWQGAALTMILGLLLFTIFATLPFTH